MSNSAEKEAKKKKITDWLNNYENTASDRKLTWLQRGWKGAKSAGLGLVSGIGGGYIGSAISTKWALPVSFLTAVTGEIIGFPPLTYFGVGMLAGNVMSDDGVHGTDEPSKVEKMKSRMKTYREGMMKKFYLDKLIKKKTTTDTSTSETNTDIPTNGMGEVQYFKYPKAQPDELDLKELEKYENEIKNSAVSYSANNPNVSGIVDENLLGTDEDRIY